MAYITHLSIKELCQEVQSHAQNLKEKEEQLSRREGLLDQREKDVSLREEEVSHREAQLEKKSALPAEKPISTGPKRRGRPPKVARESNDGGVSAPAISVQKRGRGRPKKNQVRLIGLD